MATCFEAVPVIDFSRLSRADTKGQTLNDLRRAIFDVGFLYLVNTGLEVFQYTFFSPANFADRDCFNNISPF